MGLSVHVLNTSQGRPAAEVGVTLTFWSDGEWKELARSSTDADGRCLDLLPVEATIGQGRYCVRFATGAYFTTTGERCLYPWVDVVFDVTDRRHYHIPLLLTANGYTTYRGT